MDQEELKRAGDICLKHQVIMVVDEIHCDMIFQPYRHHTFASLGEEYAMNSVICLSTSKTFNLAGLQAAVAAIPNLSLKQKFDQVLHSRDISRPTLFGQEAMRAAYQYGDTWLDELIQYIQGNFEYTYHKINGATDQMRVIDSEGTYLAWIDCSGLGLNSNEIQPFFLNQANVSLTSGAACGPGGKQSIRMNLAYPRSVVTEAVTKLFKSDPQVRILLRRGGRESYESRLPLFGSYLSSDSRSGGISPPHICTIFKTVLRSEGIHTG